MQLLQLFKNNLTKSLETFTAALFDIETFQDFKIQTLVIDQSNVCWQTAVLFCLFLNIPTYVQV